MRGFGTHRVDYHLTERGVLLCRVEVHESSSVHNRHDGRLRYLGKPFKTVNVPEDRQPPLRKGRKIGNMVP